MLCIILYRIVSLYHSHETCLRMYVRMYHIYLNRSLGVYFPWLIFDLMFICAHSAFDMGVYLL